MSETQFTLQMNANNMSTPQKEKEAHSAALLMSPPEIKRQDVLNTPQSVTMSRTSSSASMEAPMLPKPFSMGAKSQLVLLSPPISPYERPRNSQDEVQSNYSTDPLLFPPSQESVSTEQEQVSLFPPTNAPTQEDGIVEHMSKPSAVCKEEDYKLVADFAQNFHTSKIEQLYKKKGMEGMAKHSRDVMSFYDDIERKKKAKEAMEKPKSSGYRLLAPSPEGGVRKKVTMPKAKPTPRARKQPEKLANALLSSPIRESKPKAPKLPVSKDTQHWTTVPDYSPPLDSIPDVAKPFGSDFGKPSALDLSDDADRIHLHPAELFLASHLRLSCAVYLLNKRRIFQAKKARVDEGRDFKRTDAQQACKIDVNKASKLWVAFDKVGWLQNHWFIGKQPA